MKKRNHVVWFTVFATLTLAVWLGLATDVFSQNLESDNKAELAKKLIVKVTGKKNFGAGIIFSVRGGYLFMATANHVIRDSTEGVEVEFEFLRGVPLNVELIHSYPKLDLAVLRVNVQESRFQEAHVTLPFDQISDVSNINRGDAVYPVGHPEGEAWDIPLTPSTVKKAIAEEIHFEPACFPGNSGGGLFDEQWNLIGMVIRARARSCEAVSFERIRATLEDDWGLEVDREPLALGPTETPKIPEETPDQEPDTQEEEKQQKIAQLLKQADAYFERQWYTTLEGTNAFDGYREVLKLDPTNEHAYRQIDKMAKFYKSRAEREVKQGRAKQAIQFYRKYLTIVPNDEEILDRVAELEEQSSSTIIWDSTKWDSGRWQ